MMPVQVRCAVCGALSLQNELTSTSAFGPPDLDLRPAEPARSALLYGVQRCDACGYCWRRIGEAPLEAAETVASAVYGGVARRSKLPRLARSYFCAALVAEAADDAELAARHFLEAAWACDDRQATAGARTCRERAAEMLHIALEQGETRTDPAVARTLLAEHFRRAGRFDDAVTTCDTVERHLQEHDNDHGAGTVAAFIRQRALDEDAELHNCAEVFTDG